MYFELIGIISAKHLIYLPVVMEMSSIDVILSLNGSVFLNSPLVALRPVQCY